uniref:Uncharacterized protein n=1 Tax=Anguilla anguilla TaxID=7936 RepID=A0A0E9WE36_ANGAN
MADCVDCLEELAESRIGQGFYSDELIGDDPAGRPEGLQGGGRSPMRDHFNVILTS